MCVCVCVRVCVCACVCVGYPWGCSLSLGVHSVLEVHQLCMWDLRGG